MPTTSRGVVQAGVVGMANAGPLGVINPGVGVMSGATKAVGVVWGAVRSNVTLEEDWRIYRKVLEDVNHCLDGFECNPLPAYDEIPSGASTSS